MDGWKEWKEERKEGRKERRRERRRGGGKEENKVRQQRT